VNGRYKSIFLLLILAQAFHSLEEYFGQLWNVFPPAKYLTSLVSADIESGFITINIGLFIFGLWCWFIPVLRNYSYSKGLMIFWIVIEIINGIGHPLWSIMQRSYTPGVATAPLLFTLAMYLSLLISKKNQHSR